MEANKDEAYQCLELANHAITEGNIDKAEKLINKSYKLYPNSEVDRKRGLSFRGKRHEAAYSLTDETLDHGTFLEILILLGKFDPILKNHLDHVALKSKKAHQKNKTGRGSLVTFFSKTTINSIIQIICQIMRQNIVNEIKSAGMFSIQIDTTQDVKVEDQCSIIIRYLTDSVKERLIAVTNVKSSTGESMFQLVKETLEVNGVDLKYCIGSSTDGASNMQGRYKGFSKYLSDENPSQLHVVQDYRKMYPSFSRQCVSNL
ncbi:uncharacterized protein LOC103307807 [Acyrthosiphon pisum]|uniref:DUF4371 domain-containing protein n=1 Tax=Acyrthosiphon pisum TaxID=7029 RepID=A0A8R2NV52_ACYPI|nr:uncharacterized protein LOC103307807 [Acyrthosiphon pisum]